MLLLVAAGCARPGYQFGKDVLAVVEGEPVTLEEYMAASEPDSPRTAGEKEKLLNTIVRHRLLARKAESIGLLGDLQVFSGLENFYTEKLPRMLKEKIAGETTVTDEDIPGFAEKSELKPVLLVAGVVAPSIKAAEAAQADIKKGAPFEEIAKKHSAMTLVDREVDLADSLYPVGVRAVLNGMKPGSTSPVMKIDIGYAIFKVKARREPDEVWKSKADAQRGTIKNQKVEGQLLEIIDRWRRSTEVKLMTGKSPDGESIYTGAEIDGVKIKIDPSMLTGRKDPHSPHGTMNAKTLKDALKSKVNNYFLSKEARLRGLQDDPKFQVLVKLKKEEILADVYIEKVKGEYAVTPQDIQDYYNKNKEKLAVKPSVRVSRILLPSREDAEAALENLKAGKDFSSVAKLASTDTKTAGNGGDAGFVVPEKLDEPVKSALSGMKVGDTSGILKTEYGYEILKVTDKKEGGEPEMSAVMDHIKKRVLLIKKSERLESFYETAFKEADIKINKDALKSL